MGVVLSEYDKKTGYTCGIDGGGKILKVESSNKSVAAVKKSQYCFFLIPKKLGTTKITVTALSGKKKIKRSGTVNVVKFQNPFQELKVNNKSYKSKLNASYNSIKIKTKKAKNKLKIKLKPGWEIDSDSWIMKDYHPTNYTLKNGQKYSLEKGEELEMLIEVKNKKNGLSIGTHLIIQR